MLPEELNDYFKYYVESLGNSTSAEDIKREGFIPSIKDLLEKGVNVNLKDNKGNTLLHYLVSNEAIRDLSNEERKSGDYQNVLDVPFMLATYKGKVNPFEIDANGFTASALAAFHNNMRDHAMLTSLENKEMMRQMTKGLYALSQMMATAEFVDSRGYRSGLSDQQNANFVSAWNGLRKIMQRNDDRSR